jgi:demethylmenaquinone methyltransferase/2-methoxy-6-polyprenyl-1,4-benzoquinol methylase
MTTPDSAAVQTMFGRIAHRYDLANRLLSAGLDTGWRRRLVAAVLEARPASVLDVATGSGDVAFAIARALPAATNVVGIDFCAPMLAEAEKKRAKAGLRAFPRVRFQEGDALNLPLADSSFEAVTIAFGLRNLSDRPRFLAEAARVLSRAGTLFVLEFSQPARAVGPPYYFYLRRVLPVLGRMLTGDREAYTYLDQSIRAFPGRAALADEMRRGGFAQVQVFTLAAGAVALHQARK